MIISVSVNNRGILVEEVKPIDVQTLLSQKDEITEKLVKEYTASLNLS